MTAAARTNKAAPMTVARGGREGAPIQVTPTFSSRNAFTNKEARFGKVMTTVQNSLVREIHVGNPPTPSFPKATNFTNPDRAGFMQRIKVDVPYKGTVLASPRKETNTPVTDRVVNREEARELLTGKNAITLYERPKTLKPVDTAVTSIEKKATQTKIAETPRISSQEKVIAPVKPSALKAPSLAEIGLTIIKAEKPTTPVVKQPEIAKPIEKKADSLTEMRIIERAARDTSLTHVREALQSVKMQPVKETEQSTKTVVATPVVRTEGTKPVITKVTEKPARKQSPLETIQERAARKATPKPYNPIIILHPKAEEILQSTLSATPVTKKAEKKILTQYLENHILPNSAKTAPLAIGQQKEVKKRMVSQMTSPEKKEGGSQVEAQLLGDSANRSEEIAMKKINALVKESQLSIQLAKMRGEDVSVAEQKALALLHTRIQEKGLLSVFLKVKTSVTQEITGNTVTQEAAQPVPPQKRNDEETKKEQKENKKPALKIELDKFADRFRRIFMKMRAHRAFEKAKARGRKVVTTGEIAKEIGTYQYQFTKSEPVRYTNKPDGSITETLADFRASNQIVKSVDEADQLIDQKITQKAPVRMTTKIKTQPRGLLDLIRVMGYPQELTELMPAPTLQTA